MGKMPTNSLGKSSRLKLHCFCLFDAYSMPKDMCSGAGLRSTVLANYCLLLLSLGCQDLMGHLYLNASP